MLARLLTPADFGLIAMISVFFAVAEVFVKSGLGMAYVQKKEVDETDADTVFYTNLGISVVLYAFLYLGAPFIADFYGQPQLVNLTRVMGLVVIVNAFNIIQRSQITRELDFKKLTKVTIITSVSSGSIGVTAAYNGFGVWALVLQSLCNPIFIAVWFWVTSTYRPGRRFSKKSFNEMFSFGFWFLIAGVITKIFDNIYILVIGKNFPAAELGYYTKARQFKQMAADNLDSAVGTVAFPVYSRLQHDKQRLRNSMRRFMQHSLLFITPMLFGLIVVAEPFVRLLLTDTWAPMIPYLQLLCVAGILKPINTVNVQTIIALGNTKLAFKINFLRNSLRIVNIILMYRYGVFYIILGEVVLYFIIVVIHTWYTHRFVDYGLWYQLKDIWKIIVAGIFAAYLGFLPTLISENLILHFTAGVIITGSAFFTIQFLFNNRLLMDSISLIKSITKQ